MCVCTALNQQKLVAAATGSLVPKSKMEPQEPCPTAVGGENAAVCEQRAVHKLSTQARCADAPYDPYHMPICWAHIPKTGGNAVIDTLSVVMDSMVQHLDHACNCLGRKFEV